MSKYLTGMYVFDNLNIFSVIVLPIHCRIHWCFLPETIIVIIDKSLFSN